MPSRNLFRNPEIQRKDWLSEAQRIAHVEWLETSFWIGQLLTQKFVSRHVAIAIWTRFPNVEREPLLPANSVRMNCKTRWLRSDGLNRTAGRNNKPGIPNGMRDVFL